VERRWAARREPVRDFGEPVAAASLAQAHDARCSTAAGGGEGAAAGDRRRVAEDARCWRSRRGSSSAGRRGAAAGARRFAATVIRATELELDLRLEAAGADELAR
jgi:ubiquinone biosynthesis protein